MRNNNNYLINYHLFIKKLNKKKTFHQNDRLKHPKLSSFIKSLSFLKSITFIFINYKNSAAQN